MLTVVCAAFVLTLSACGPEGDNRRSGSGAIVYDGETNLANILSSFRVHGVTEWQDILALYNALADPMQYRNYDTVLYSFEGQGTMFSRAIYVIITNILVVIGADPEYSEEYEPYKQILKRALENPGSGGIGDYVFAYLALKTAGEEFNETPVREHLEGLQLADGGFASSGSGVSEVDMTAAALPALVLMDSESVSGALEFLRGSINEDGTFSNAGEPNAQSTALALSALMLYYGADAGIIQQAREGLGLFETGGGFSRLQGGAREPIATAYGAVALGDLQNGINVWLKLYNEWQLRFGYGYMELITPD